MDQQKIGSFLKKLRNQKGLTQEQFAEIVNVSNRTVSRWENGNNMPDLDVLIQISDYYEIELRELLDGDRKGGNMNKEFEETVLKAVDYSNAETEKFTKKIHWLFLAGIVCWFISFVSQVIGHTGPNEIDILSALSDFAEGVTCGLFICGFILTSRYGLRIKAFKQRVLKKQS